MASISHIIDNLWTVFDELESKNRACDPQKARINGAALTIQRYWRGYACRNAINKLHQAATIIQKYYKRHFVLTHWEEIVNAFLHLKNQAYYDKMASKIKALWKGYYQRTYVFNFLEYYRKKKMMEERSRLLLLKIKEMNENAAREYALLKEREAKKKVMAIISKIHHFLRTHREGIYSLHGKTELSWIEEVMKSAKYNKYMKALRKEYNKKYYVPKRELHLTGIWKQCEEAYYLRDTSQDTREISEKKPSMQQEERFCLDTRYSYRDPTDILTKEDYKRAITDIMRTTDKTKNVSPKEFKITRHISKTAPKVPDYFIDFWERVCEIHNIVE